MNKGFFALISTIAISCFSHSSMAAILDFTDRNQTNAFTSITNGFSGTIDGIGFILTSTDGTVNFNENYDGSLSAGCQSSGGALACGSDGAAINNDEITGASVSQKLTLTFDRVVKISELYVLDLYVGNGNKEQATITFDGASSVTIDAIESTGQGGYANLIMGPILAQTLTFTATLGSDYWDDINNDYSLAGVKVSAVPIPAAAFLFAPALLGLMGLRRRAKQKIA